MSLDHGVLSAPLAMRGDIDKALDKYKRERATDKKKEAKARHAARLAARKLIEAVGQRAAEGNAARTGCSIRAELALLKAMAHFEPGRAIPVLRSWMSPDELRAYDKGEGKS